MSKFQSTISTVAALASIFGAGAAGWKLAQTQPEVTPTDPQPAIEQKLTQLEQKLEEKLTIPLQQPLQQPSVAPQPLPTPPAPEAPPEPITTEEQP